MTEGRSPRICLIGMDAAEPALIERGCDAGRLPTLRWLRNNGTWITLDQDGEIPSAAVWPTSVTGTHAGRHGVFHSMAIVPGTTALSIIPLEEPTASPFWSLLDDADRRSIVMDVPFSPPAGGSGGIRIVDWGSYERFHPPHSAPPDVLAALIRAVGAYPFGAEISRDVLTSPSALRRLRARLLTGVATKGAASRWLLSHYPWDCFMTVFGETHAAGHLLWEGADEAHQDGGRSGLAASAVPLGQVYEAVDRQIAEILGVVGTATTVIVLSGQGMGRNVGGWQLLPPFLERLGLLKWTSDRRTTDGAQVARKIRGALPASLRRAISRRLPASVRDALRGYWATAGIDWARTRAFHLPTDRLGYIRINLQGREPNGIVKPGAEYDALCQRITEALHDLVHPTTGRPLVKRVIRAAHTFSGPRQDRLPDLTVAWMEDAVIDRACSREVGTLTGVLPDGRPGNHRPDGFAILSGPGIPAGARDSGHLLDVAPTMLCGLGVTPPAYMQGRSWIEDSQERSDAVASQRLGA